MRSCKISNYCKKKTHRILDVNGEALSSATFCDKPGNGGFKFVPPPSIHVDGQVGDVKKW
jgi:hypothetical protein